eukprot:Seg1732.7 transcript_id=Seg1732.7/GoldUCD/mRNA.D3Y31 product=Galaxin protein_id=Seg1732.7/GoldUCD/D3Y31
MALSKSIHVVLLLFVFGVATFWRGDSYLDRYKTRYGSRSRVLTADEKCQARWRKFSYATKRMFRCCAGRIVYKPSPVSHCCGKQAYSPLRQICCGEKPYFKTERYTACCVDEPYEPGKQSCCGNQVINVTVEGCCRNMKYNKIFAACCEGSIVPNYGGTDCCGPFLYSKNNSICCARFLLPLTPGAEKHTSCCKDQSFDTRTHICCGDRIIRKNDPSDAACCSGKPYNPKKKFCCEYKTHDFAPGAACCREKSRGWGLDAYRLYNATTQVCCLGKINKKSYGSNTYCCKKNSYNHATDMCCNYMVKRKRPGDNSCCGNFPYNANRYLCCSGKLRVKRSRYHLCCFGQTYDNRYYMCQARRDGVIGGYVLRRGGGSAA